MIRGGQGRSGADVHESATAMAWCMFLALAMLSILAWLQGGAS